MNFRSWTRTLADRGLRVIAPSHPAPIELWAELPGGDIVHFRCRGTGASLTRYAADDIVSVVPADDCACGCGRRTGPATVARAITRPGVRPREIRRFDGRAERGWTSYEAGLLKVDEAAALFDRLLPQPGADPVATGRELSTVHSDHEPG